MRIIFLSLIFLPVLLSGCGGSTAPLEENAKTSERSGPISVDRTPVYTEYVDRITGHGVPSILFFAAKNDLFSLQSDKVLIEAYASGSPKYSTFRIDALAATGAKLQFGVFVPDTFVLLGGQGERVGALVHPTAEELRALLRSGSLPQ